MELNLKKSYLKKNFSATEIAFVFISDELFFKFCCLNQL